MCGVIGLITLVEQINKEHLISASNQLKHRGPDDSGIFISDNKKVGIAHRRLSFIDLSTAGKQPITNVFNGITIAFNGEIYNYLSLKEQLISNGYIFNTLTDTEVILNAYHYWGKNFVTYLEGMFAIAIYDERKNSVFLVRDRFGIKPMNYAISKNKFVFGSEVKALFEINGVEKVISKKSVSLFLANRYVPTPHTMWENIFKMSPATYLEIDCKTLSIKETRYWDLKFGNDSLPHQEFNNTISELIQKSTKDHLISDTEIGAFLSGGIDSSLLLGMMSNYVKRIKAFSLGFTNWNLSEHHFAKEVAEEIDANLKYKIIDKSTLQDVKELMYYFDDPIADVSIIPTFYVSQLAKANVKAVVSGEGADEIFAGYHWQKPGNFIYKNRLQKLKSNFFGVSFEQIKQHYIQSMSMGLFDSHELKLALNPNFNTDIPDDPFSHFDKFRKDELSTLKQIQYLDINCFMYELVLQKIDKASMANSLEVRVPFLNHRLVEFVFSLNPKVYFDEAIQKKPLQEILSKYFKTKVFNRKKQGFTGPDSFYMDYKLYELELLNGTLVSEQIINKDYIQNLLVNKDHWRLWKLFVLEFWWQQNV